jgi:hypothetical protein
MMNEEICIRLPNDGINFIDSIWRGDEVIESALVYPIGLPHYRGSVVPMAAGTEYYGGSQAMD